MIIIIKHKIGFERQYKNLIHLSCVNAFFGYKYILFPMVDKFLQIYKERKKGRGFLFVDNFPLRFPLAILRKICLTSGKKK